MSNRSTHDAPLREVACRIDRHPSIIEAAAPRRPAPPEWSLERLTAEVRLALPPDLDHAVLAFSGGADSVALLTILLRLQRRPKITAVHIDHRLDPGSTERAQRAREIALDRALAAGHCSVSAVVESTDLPERDDRAHGGFRFIQRELRITDTHRRAHGGLEAAARALRYRELHAIRAQVGAQAVLTAHHADDQLETLVLRLRQGTGLVGLAGIRATQFGPTGGPENGPEGGRVLRPLLDLADPPTAAQLRDVLEREQVTWIEDPTNADRTLARNAVRHAVLPALRADDPDAPQLVTRAVRLARAAARFATWREGWARATLDLRTSPDGADLDFERWRRLPPSLRVQALGALHRAAGRAADPPAAAQAELLRQVDRAGSDRRGASIGDLDPPTASRRLSTDDSISRQPSGVAVRCNHEARPRIACAAGSGWGWIVDQAACPPTSPRSDLRSELRLWLRPEPRRSQAPTLGKEADFTYTPRIPGVTEMPEVGCSLQITREPYDGWMRRAWPDRAACHLPDPRATVTVRNRTIGDTLHPFGSPSKRVKLKKLLIDRKVPRDQRQILPLVCVDGEIAWVPGVTIGNAFRIPASLTGPGPDRSGNHADKSDPRAPSNQLVWVFRLLPTGSPPSR